LKFFEFAHCFFVPFIESPVSSAGARRGVPSARTVLNLFLGTVVFALTQGQ